MNDNSIEGNKIRPRRFQFTLQTLFVVTTVVALCIGLLIHYGFCAGLFLATFVFSFASCYDRRDKTGMVVHAILFVVFWLILQFFGPYTCLRNRVVWIVGTERLQQWTVETLDNPPSPDKRGEMLLEKENLPDDIRGIAGYRPRVVPAQDGHEAYIDLYHGGGFYRWGILAGRPGFVPSGADHCEKIADGIWGYHGE